MEPERAWMVPGQDGGIERQRALQQRAHARRELRLFMRRLGILLVALDRAGDRRHDRASSLIEGISVGVRVRLDARHGHDPRDDPRSPRRGRPGAQGRPRAARHRYALLRPGDGRGVLRLRPAQRRARGAPDPEDDRLLQRPLHHLRLRPRRPPGRARPARGGRRVRRDRPQPEEPRGCARRPGSPLIESEAADDEVLTQAGIERAQGVIACVDSDAENIFIALTARELRSDILIVARASAEDSEKKLLRAGADRVISPYKTSGSEMARVALHPQVGGRARASPTTGWRRSRSRPTCEAVGTTIARRARRVGDRGDPAPGRPARAPAAAADRARAPATSSSRWARRPRSSGSSACSSRRGLLGDPRSDPGARDGPDDRRRSARGAAPPRCAPRRPPCAAAARRAARPQPTLERPRREGQGDYSTNAAMLLAPVLGAPPREIAERIGAELEGLLGDELERAEVAGPGLPEPGAVRRLAPAGAALGARRRRRGSAPAAPSRPSGS